MTFAQKAPSLYTVQALAKKLADAYSVRRYKGGWAGCIKMLRNRGYNDAQIETILRSKIARWASIPTKISTAKDLASWMDQNADEVKSVLEESND